MKSDLPKVLHTVGGIPMAELVIRAAREAGAARMVVVIGHRAELVRAALGEGVAYARQEEPLGTGHATACARAGAAGAQTVMVLCGDTPLVTGRTLRRLAETHRREGAVATVLTTVLSDPTGYGRIIRGEKGRVRRIVEEADATPAEKAVREINTGIYVFQAARLWEALAEIRPNNAQGEYYLTDCIAGLVGKGFPVAACSVEDAVEAEGVNNPDQLARVEEIFRRRPGRDGAGAPG
jgi:bifunctional UDP-N-acetylglucosamine pyrophosphorylase/glucosamine-1-phosphate N-acetyltransferase